MEYDIFVSYSRKDSEVVQSVVGRLKAEGYRCWMDVTGIESSDEFKRVLVKAISASKVVIFFSSANSNSTPWTVKEINVAVQMKKPIIPVRLDATPYDESIMFDLSGIDFVACSGEQEQTQGIEKLVRSLSVIINRKETVDAHRQESSISETREFNGKPQGRKSVAVKARVLGCSMEAVIMASIVVCAGYCGIWFWASSVQDQFGVAGNAMAGGTQHASTTICCSQQVETQAPASYSRAVSTQEKFSSVETIENVDDNKFSLECSVTNLHSNAQFRVWNDGMESNKCERPPNCGKCELK